MAERGTERLYELLEHQIGQESFADELHRQKQLAELPDKVTARDSKHGEVLSEDWWEVDGRPADVSEDTGDYIVIEREDVVHALSDFIAAYVMSLPDAQRLEPREVQAAVAATFKELRKGRVRRLLDWGKYLYRATALGYGAFSAFSNPVIAQAVSLFPFLTTHACILGTDIHSCPAQVLAALWTCIRMIGRIAGGV